MICQDDSHFFFVFPFKYIFKLFGEVYEARIHLDGRIFITLYFVWKMLSFIHLLRIFLLNWNNLRFFKNLQKTLFNFLFDECRAFQFNFICCLLKWKTQLIGKISLCMFCMFCKFGRFHKLLMFSIWWYNSLLFYKIDLHKEFHVRNLLYKYFLTPC